MKTRLTIAVMGLLSSAMLLKPSPTLAQSFGSPEPLVVTATVTASISNLVTLEFTTNLFSPTWQSLGTFIGQTNVAFTNTPVVFLRGACSSLMASATLRWNPSSDPNVTGYMVYYGIASQAYSDAIDVGNVTVATIHNLIPGVTYYFAAMAYTPSGQVSSLSNEASGSFQPAFSLTMTCAD